MTKPFVDRIGELRCLNRTLKYDGTETPVLVFTGIGGMGKTALRMAFEEQILKPQTIPYAVLDYDGDPNLRSIEATLRTIRRQLGRHNVKTPVFDFLYARYFELSTGLKLSEKHFPPELEGVVFILKGIPGVGHVASITYGLSQLGLVAKERLQHKAWLYRVRDLEPRELLNLLPEVLADDLEEAISAQHIETLEDSGCRICLLFDGYERLSDSHIDDTLHRKLLSRTPHLLRAIFTRASLPWEHAHPKEWSGKIVHFPALDDLTKDDATILLRRKHVDDANLQEHLYQLTKGYPLHLELCADICREIKEITNREPHIQDFEGAIQAKDLTKELIDRLLRQLTDNERDLMELAAYPRWVSEEVLEVLSSVPESVPRIFGKFTKLSMFSPHAEIPDAYVIRKEVRDCMLLQLKKSRYFRQQHGKLSRFHRERWEEIQSVPHLREGLYHGFYDNPEETMGIFDEHFGQLLKKFSFAEAEGLLEAIPIEILNEQQKRKVKYARARLLTAQSSSRHSLMTAKSIYDELIATETQERLLDQYLFTSGSLQRTLGDYDKALECHEKCLSMRMQMYGEGHPKTAESYHIIGIIYTDKGESVKALENHEKALAIYQKAYGSAHSEIASSYNSIGIIYEQHGEYEKALEYFQKSLVIVKQVDGNEHPRVAKTYGNIGVVYDLQGEYDKALDCYEHCLSIMQKIYGENHPDVAKTYKNIGVVYGRSGDCDKALDFHNKSLTIYLNIFGDEHPDTARSYHSIGVNYSKKGEQKKALEFLEKSLAIQLKIHGEDHRDVALDYNSLGIAYTKLGEFSKARDILQRCLAIRLRLYGEKHPDTAETYYGMGEACYEQSRHQEALDYYQKAQNIWLSVFGNDHPNIAKCHIGCASALWALRQENEAFEKMHTGVEMYQKFKLWKEEAKSLETLAGWLEDRGRSPEAEATRAKAQQLLKDHIRA